MSLLKHVVALLRSRSTPFALIGAAAMAVHGVSRSTRDLDLFVIARECLSPAYWDSLRTAEFDVNIQEGDTEDPLAGVVRLTAADQPPVDIVVGKPAWQAEILSRATETEIEGISVPVADPADLILLKLYAGGPQDAWDIQQLLACEERSAVIRGVERHLEALPEECRALWARLRS